MRMHHLAPEDRYEALARKIAEVMPEVGRDKQRGGWYDMVERELAPGEEFHRLIWHDRKAWWQQEQGILAYLILAGSLKDPEYLRLARESSAFYNAFFLDHDSGGVYFNVLANGIPYLLGTERLKGSHSMAAYHSFELCYLAAVYTNLLLTKQPLDLYFKPRPGAFKDNILRVAPDLLPPGSIRIDAVWVNGNRYADFDPEALTVRLPAVPVQRQAPSATASLAMAHAAGNGVNLSASAPQSLDVRVVVAPASLPYQIESELTSGTARLTLGGELDDSAAIALRLEFKRICAARPNEVILRVSGLRGMSARCARVLAFAEQELDATTTTVIGASPEVKHTLAQAGVIDQYTLLDVDPAEDATARAAR